MFDVGFKNYIRSDLIYKVIPTKSSFARWIVKEAIANKKIINCTQGGKTKSIIIMKSRHVVLSTIKCLSIKKRLETHQKEIEPDGSGFDTDDGGSSSYDELNVDKASDANPEEV